MRAGLLTLSARDAGVFAGLACGRARILTVAHNNDRRVLGDHRDHLFGTKRHTKSATEATGRVDVRNDILYADRTCGARGSAISASKATETAFIGPTVNK